VASHAIVLYPGIFTATKTEGISECGTMSRDERFPESEGAIARRLGRTTPVVLAFLASLVSIQPGLPAQQPAADKATGTWVIPKNADYELRDGRGNVIATTDQAVFFRVERVEGQRLWLRDDYLNGWINADQVVSGDAAIAYFSSAIKDHPDDSYAFTARGLSRQTFRGDLDGAIADYTAAIKLRPRDATFYNLRAYAFYLKREYDRAIADHNHAIRFGPNEAVSFNYRGLVWMAKKDNENALADFNDAIRLAPGSAMAYYHRGRVRSEYREDYVNAIADYNHAIELSPRNAQALNSLAWLLATCPDAKHRDGKKAIESARKACEITNWNDPMVIDTLAAAQAESGDFDSAARSQSKAIGLLSNEAQKTEFRARLKLYQEKKASHLPKPK